jgi:hypothetical protein
VKMIPKYLQRTKDMFLGYGGDEQLFAKGYTGATFTSDPNDLKSQWNFVFTLNRCTVCWKMS